MSPSQVDIDGVQKLIEAHRSTLMIYLEQRALHGPANVPVSIVHGITQARNELARLKGTLRTWNVDIEDLPQEEHDSLTDLHKDSIPNPKEVQAARRLLIYEIQHNIERIQKAYTDVRNEERLYKETFKSDGAGGYTTEGNPTRVLARFHPEALSRQVWDTHLHLLSFALSEEEIRSAFSFYSSLQEVTKLQQIFQGPNTASAAIYNSVLGQRREDVMDQLKYIVEHPPIIV